VTPRSLTTSMDEATASFGSGLRWWRQGDPAHPFTRGVLCNKLDDFVAYTRSPERLLYPMRRVGPKGAGDFERISWDEALDEIAERLSRIIREFGAEAIWPYLGSGSMGLLQGVYGAGRRLWNVVGAFRHLMTICTIAGGVGRWPGLSKDGATVNATVDERDSDMGGGAVFHDNRVEIERLAP
jgi:anaerobic selenocysteine-containing dehydrogenase